MFNSHIGPILEYNCEIWFPLYLKDIDKLENIQRRFTKRITGLFNFSYVDRLRICGMEMLELRRIKLDLIFVYKMINGLVKINFDDFFTFAPDRGLRGNSMKLYPKFTRKTSVLNSFEFRVVNIWNSLSNDVVVSCSLSVFKKKLNKIDDELFIFLKGRAAKNP